ncbi:Nicotinate phosphoribosyltransferase 2 [Glycine soja]
MVTPMLADQYQFIMAYAYWKAGKHQEQAVTPLEECVRFVTNYKLTKEDIDYIKNNLSVSCEDGFLDYLRGIDCSDVEFYAIPKGSVVFLKVPLLRIEGPIAVVQLLETPFVYLINFASLVSTNAARHRFVAGKPKTLLEFGLRRAQGPDGGVGASKYSYIGGFDATSNVAAGMLFGIPLRDTHSHAFVSSFMRSNSLRGNFAETNQSELAAFTYALAFPDNFLALVDADDVMRSGIPNFCVVALALSDLGYKAIGIRLDSGDLGYLSCEIRKLFCSIEKEFGLPGFGKMNITTSNDLNEEKLDALNKQVNSFGNCSYFAVNSSNSKCKNH